MKFDFFHHPRGSILIWSVMLGLMLTSIFFFFGTRLARNAGLQREVMEKQADESYAQSFADYLDGLTLAELTALGPTISFDGMEGTLSQEAQFIEGFLESGASTPAPYNISTSITLEWNRCDWGEQGDLLIDNDTLEQHTGNCQPNQLYDDAVTLTPTGSLSLQAITAPLHFRIRSNTATLLTDTQWHLTLSMPLSFGKEFKIEKTF